MPNGSLDEADGVGDSDFEDEEIANAKGIVAIASSESVLAKRRGEDNVPVVAPEQLCDVEFIMDTGADYDVYNRKRAQEFRDFIRKRTDGVVVDTAGGERKADDGLRMQVAWSDGPNDYLLLKDSPSLMSIGSRTKSQFTFVWVRTKNYACFVDVKRRK